jgi:serine/threonine protein kinase
MYKVGSPLYMPPETIKNSVYSLKTDSYALGVLFFYITTKDFPYPGNNNK